MRCRRHNKSALAISNGAADNRLFRVTLTNTESQTFQQSEKGALGTGEMPALTAQVDTADRNDLSFVPEESWKFEQRYTHIIHGEYVAQWLQLLAILSLCGYAQGSLERGHQTTVGYSKKLIFIHFRCYVFRTLGNKDNIFIQYYLVPRRLSPDTKICDLQWPWMAILHQILFLCGHI